MRKRFPSFSERPHTTHSPPTLQKKNMAGNGRGKPKAGTKAKKKAFKRKFWTCRRTKDTDQIQDEIKAIEDGTRTVAAYHNEDAPGGGDFYCLPCARHFVSEEVLTLHRRSKPHKKMVKVCAQPQYTQKEADAGAGMSS